MHEYEVLIETINPCGGEAHSKKEFLDVKAESPEAWFPFSSLFRTCSQNISQTRKQSRRCIFQS